MTIDKTTNIRDLIKTAITNKKLIGFTCKRQHIIAEPHAYGLKNGKIQLLVYQIDGYTKSGNMPRWRGVSPEEMSNLILLNKEFYEKRVFQYALEENFDKVLELVT